MARDWKAAKALLALAVGMLVVPIYLGVSTLTMSPDAAASGCDAHYIDGITLNTTHVTADLVSKVIGATNAWCTAPKSSLPPENDAGKGDMWREGDNVFEPLVKLFYKLPGDVRVDFHAEAHFIVGGRVTAGCSVNNPNGAGPARFTCYTSTTDSGEGKGGAYFVIAPVTPEKGHAKVGRH
jgi:hypothetical protein